MKVRSEFWSQVLSYVVGTMDLKSFREWQLAQLLDRDNLDTEEVEFLLTIEGRYADLLAGAPESSLMESLKLLLSGEAQQAPIQYFVRYYVISASPVLVDAFATADQSVCVTGANVPNQAIFAPCLA